MAVAWVSQLLGAYACVLRLNAVYLHGIEHVCGCDMLLYASPERIMEEVVMARSQRDKNG